MCVSLFRVSDSQILPSCTPYAPNVPTFCDERAGVVGRWNLDVVRKLEDSHNNTLCKLSIFMSALVCFTGGTKTLLPVYPCFESKIIDPMRRRERMSKTEIRMNEERGKHFMASAYHGMPPIINELAQLSPERTQDSFPFHACCGAL